MPTDYLPQMPVRVEREPVPTISVIEDPPSIEPVQNIEIIHGDTEADRHHEQVEQ